MSIKVTIPNIPPFCYPRLALLINLIDFENIANHFAHFRQLIIGQ